jgi:hypothetical protein
MIDCFAFFKYTTFINVVFGLRQKVSIALYRNSNLHSEKLQYKTLYRLLAPISIK